MTTREFINNKMKDKEIKVFVSTDSLLYTPEFVGWLNEKVDEPEKWIGEEDEKTICRRDD